MLTELIDSFFARASLAWERESYEKSNEKKKEKLGRVCKSSM
jgi:hypothetical protein